MSEDQGKPKWYEIRRIYLFICMLVILLTIAGVVVMGIGGSITYSREYAYDSAKIELQNAVTDYQGKNNGTLPTINGTVTINSSAYRIINICPLLTQMEEPFRFVLDSLWSGNGSNDDNCDGGCTGCNTYNHSSYIWAVDADGNVFSYCAGAGCTTNNSGYQDVWP